MILRDPVHGLISFEGVAERVVEPLLATREVQRLRRVRQLGLASLVFPGAEHSRFAHAVGTAHVMVRLLERLRVCQDQLPRSLHLDDEATADALAASLLHDVGHGPFSHTFEEVVPGARHHEEWTAEILRSAETEVHRALERISKGMSDRVASLLEGDYRLPYLARAVSGTLDVDRCDYLLRDSHMTGVRYGLYDLDWLLRALRFGGVPTDDGGCEWVLAIEGRKGLPPIESFFLGRHFMYQQVYHHKATRAAEAIVRATFVRIAELVRDGRPPHPIPPAFSAAARGSSVSLAEYLAVDDAELLACFAEWEVGPDAILADLARRVRDRRLPKTVPLPEDAPPEVWEEARARVAEIADAKGLRSDLFVWLDVPTDTPYAEPVTGTPADGLWVVIRHRPIQRLGDASFLLRELRNKRLVRPRLVFPVEVREAALTALEGVIA